MVIELEHEHEHTLRVICCTGALELVALECMSLELMQEARGLVLGEMEDVLCQGFTGEPPALITPMPLGWKPAVHAPIAKP